MTLDDATILSLDRETATAILQGAMEKRMSAKGPLPAPLVRAVASYLASRALPRGPMREAWQRWFELSDEVRSTAVPRDYRDILDEQYRG